MWNLSYQRQIATNWVIKANYMGNAGRHILGSVDVNQAVSSALGPGGAAASTGNTNQRRPTYLDNPTTGQYYSDIQQSDPGANSEYHGLLLSIERHFSGHYTILSNYGWSHCSSSWDMAGELAGTLYQNSLNRQTGERGPCGFDHRQVFNTTLVATSPGVGRGRQAAYQRLAALTDSQPLHRPPDQNSNGGKDISLSGQALDRPYDMLPTQVYTGSSQRSVVLVQSGGIPVRGIERRMHRIQRSVRQRGPERSLWPGPDQFRHGPDQAVRSERALEARPARRLLQHHESRQLERPDHEHYQFHVRGSHVVRLAPIDPNGAEAVLLKPGDRP
jgi:hypothetical protein